LTAISELQRQHAAHKARQARFIAAAALEKQRLRAIQPPPPAPAPRPHRRPPPPAPIVVPRPRAAADLHVTAYRVWRFEQTPLGAAVARYVEARCTALGVSLEDLAGPSRLRPHAAARQQMMWELKQGFRLSLPQIGRYFGGRDHTTVLHAVRKMSSLSGKAGAAIAGKPHSGFPA
jgi:chromosomal replication initiator protein